MQIEGRISLTYPHLHNVLSLLKRAGLREIRDVRVDLRVTSEYNSTWITFLESSKSTRTTLFDSKFSIRIFYVTYGMVFEAILKLFKRGKWIFFLFFCNKVVPLFFRIFFSTTFHFRREGLMRESWMDRYSVLRKLWSFWSFLTVLSFSPLQTSLK